MFYIDVECIIIAIKCYNFVWIYWCAIYAKTSSQSNCMLLCVILISSVILVWSEANVNLPAGSGYDKNIVNT